VQWGWWGERKLPDLCAVDLPAEGRRSNPRYRREVRRESCHRHRLYVGAYCHQPRALGLRTAAFAFLRLWRRKWAVRVWLESLASFYYTENRQRPAPVSRWPGSSP